MSSSSSSSDDSSDDSDGPPVASSSKVAVLSLDEVKSGAKGVAEDGGAVVHPDRAKRPAPTDEAESQPAKEFQVVCRHWRRGNCAQGPSCPYLHSVRPLPLPPPRLLTPSTLYPPPQLPASSQPAPPPKKRRPAPPAPAFNPFARADPFAQLAERDVAQVTSDVMQVVEFLVRNDWLRGVEGRVGECEEEGGIEELGAVGEGGEVDGGEAKGGAGIEEIVEMGEGGEGEVDGEGMDDGEEGDVEQENEDDGGEDDEEEELDIVPVEDDDDEEEPATRWDDLVPVDDSDEFDEEDHLALFLADSS